MEVREYRTIDKTTWGDGVWQDEPDKKQWQDESTGLPCLLVRGPSGAWCGYVGVPNDHPLHGKGYGDHAPLSKETLRRLLDESGYLDLYQEDLDRGEVEVQSVLRAHGGITFAKGCQHGDDESRHICHVPSAGEPDDVWWFGFDCAHAGDYAPGMESRTPAEFRERLGSPTGWGTVIEYRDQAYVENECRQLATQIASVKPA